MFSVAISIAVPAALPTMGPTYKMYEISQSGRKLDASTVDLRCAKWRP